MKSITVAEKSRSVLLDKKQSSSIAAEGPLSLELTDGRGATTVHFSQVGTGTVRVDLREIRYCEIRKYGKPLMVIEDGTGTPLLKVIPLGKNRFRVITSPALGQGTTPIGCPEGVRGDRRRRT